MGTKLSLYDNGDGDGTLLVLEATDGPVKIALTHNLTTNQIEDLIFDLVEARNSLLGIGWPERDPFPHMRVEIKKI